MRVRQRMRDVSVVNGEVTAPLRVSFGRLPARRRPDADGLQLFVGPTTRPLRNPCCSTRVASALWGHRHGTRATICWGGYGGNWIHWRDSGHRQESASSISLDEQMNRRNPPGATPAESQ